MVPPSAEIFLILGIVQFAAGQNQMTAIWLAHSVAFQNGAEPVNVIFGMLKNLNFGEQEFNLPKGDPQK